MQIPPDPIFDWIIVIIIRKFSRISMFFGSVDRKVIFSEPVVELTLVFEPLNPPTHVLLDTVLLSNNNITLLTTKNNDKWGIMVV